MILYSIDRFEEEFAVCENLSTNEFCNIPINQLPKDSKEGSILKLVDGIFYLEQELTSEKQNTVKNIVDSLFNRH